MDVPLYRANRIKCSKPEDIMFQSFVILHKITYIRASVSVEIGDK